MRNFTIVCTHFLALENGNGPPVPLEEGLASSTSPRRKKGEFKLLVKHLNVTGKLPPPPDA